MLAGLGGGANPGGGRKGGARLEPTPEVKTNLSRTSPRTSIPRDPGSPKRNEWEHGTEIPCVSEVIVHPLLII